MEVCERLLCLAVVSSVFGFGSVLGKYVRGIVNTKEVRDGVGIFIAINTTAQSPLLDRQLSPCYKRNWYCETSKLPVMFECHLTYYTTD